MRNDIVTNSDRKVSFEIGINIKYGLGDGRIFRGNCLIMEDLIAFKMRIEEGFCFLLISSKNGSAE